MPYQEIDSEGNPVLNDEGENIIVEDLGSWDQVKAHIPEDLQEEKMWANVKDVPGLLKSYAHAQKSMGSAVKIPGPEATEEEWNEFHEKMGRPSTPEDYEVAWPEHEDVEWDTDLQYEFKKVAHDVGLTPKQVNALVEFEGKRAETIAATGRKGMKEAEDTLSAEWGGNFDRNLAYAQRAISHIGGDELKTVLNETGLGNNPTLAKAFYKMGKMLVEESVIPGEVQGAVTQEDAMSKISEIMSDESHAYHKGDADSMMEMRKLHQIAYNQ